jgi:DNA-binding MarR family transcriptional regulator
MSSQVLTTQVYEAWTSLLLGHAALTRELNAQLVSEHGLTINDYEVLLRLAKAPDRRLKRVELAQSVLLTASGITRLLDGLEKEGFVEKAGCETDARVTYAALTDDGRQKLRQASVSHVADIERLFNSRYDDDELTVLAELLGRLGGPAEAGACEPPETT